MNILNADPSYLLKKAKVKNSVGVEYNVTPLQAAIMANDIQMAQKMKAHFERLPDGLAEMHKQIKEIYLKSLRGLQPDIQISESDDISVIIATHNQAQEHNAFDFQPYVDAICNASQTELDDVMALINAKTPEETAAVIARTGVAATQTTAARAKPFDQLTLVEKLNRFREEFVAHMQKEIIFNPNHILAGLKDNEKTWDEVYANRIADPDYKKRIVIFSQLVGWAQRNAAEPVKQDIRQGTWFLIEKNEARARPIRFNSSGRNDYIDVTLLNSGVINGCGFKFGGAAADRGRVTGSFASGLLVSKFMSSKNIELGKLMQPAKSHQSRKGCAMM